MKDKELRQMCIRLCSEAESLNAGHGVVCSFHFTGTERTKEGENVCSVGPAHVLVVCT